MAELFAIAALAILAATGLALFAVLRRRSALDAMMAVQLVGTGGAACVLLLCVVLETPAMLDIAVMLSLLAAFAVAGFALPSGIDERTGGDT